MSDNIKQLGKDMLEHDDDDVRWQQSVSTKLDVLVKQSSEAATWRKAHDDMHRGVGNAPGLNDRVRSLESRFKRQDNVIKFVTGVVGTTIAAAIIGFGAWIISIAVNHGR